MAGGQDNDAHRRDAERLAALEARLAARQQPRDTGPGPAGESFNQANLAWRMVIELVSGLVIGLLIGYGLDRLLGTRPIMLVVFLFAGLAAGVRVMLRTAREVGQQAEARERAGNLAPRGAITDPPPGGDDEDEDR